MYVPLLTKSNYSFLEGASHPAELVAAAHELGLPALAMTDRDGVHGIVRAFVEAKSLGIRLIVGSQVTVATHLPPAAATGPLSAADLDGWPVETPVLLAADRAGYGRLCQLLTVGRRRCAKGTSLVTWQEIAAAAQGLVLLYPDAGLDLAATRDPLARDPLARDPKQVPALPELPDPVVRLLRPLPTPVPRDPLHQVADAFGDRAYGLLTRHHQADEVHAERRLRARMKTLGWPLVGATEVLYHSPARRPLQDVLTCIRHGVPLHQAGTRLKGNAEHGLWTPFAFDRLFADDPALVSRTLAIADRCRFSMADLRYRYPSERLPDGSTETEWLRELVRRGALDRWQGPPPDAVQAQINRELALIETLDYGGYFLTMWEIVQFCRGEGILCQGRGSAANSVVCYALGITAIDPVRMGLLFERFLSLERAEPPDIDLDIEHERREEVIQHVYAKYDRSHAAMVANVIRYRAKSAVRDVGKALGIAETSLDRLARLTSHYGDGVDEAALGLAGLDPNTQAHQLLMQLTQEIQDFPRHLSVHPGGFLLGHEPVDTLVPVENATMEARTVIQWDKEDVEALGLFKVDLLGLGMLTQVHRCFDLLKQTKGLDLSMATVPAEDPETYAMISRGDTVGVFQIESRAQMSMLPRLKPKTFYDLVIEVAIIRPGPITGGMVHPYLRRRDGEEEVVYPHPSLRPVLEKTLGVPLFQEQVMKLAMVAADYTPGEADQLRRDMAAWRKSGRIEGHHDRLVQRMTAKGIDAAFAERVFDQIRGFGEYGFPESHAASFALISYVTSWLKCHHPAEFTCALLNAQPMGFYTPATILEDARRHGVQVLPIDITRSGWDCAMVPDVTLQGAPTAVRMGLRYVRGLGARHRQAIEAAPGPWFSLDAFVRETQLDRAALEALAESGAFDGLQLDRRQALWQVRALVQRAHETLELDRHEDLPLFQTLDRQQEILWDYQRSSHSTRGHPLQPLRDELSRQGLPTAAQVNAMRDGRRLDYAGLVICRQRPGTAKGVTFFTLEDETGFVNLVVWRDVYEKFQLLAKTSAVAGVSGKLQSQHNVVHLVVERFWELQLGAVAPARASRDFH
jgi:error-prone DNA polymerase